MLNFHITYSNPWLLLLLIPSFLLTIIPYFLLPKKYRFTRNRIASMVLHLIVMVLCIGVLSGIRFNYEKPNSTNEIIFLVDMSDSNEESVRQKEEFIQSAIQMNRLDYRMGIVTFGFNQVYAAKLTNNTNQIFDQYLNAELPDTTATDIAAALNYAKTLFENPETAKIVLITDGIETDESAMTVIKSIAAEGIRVDTVLYRNRSFSEVQLVDIVLPDYNVIAGDEFILTLMIESSFSGSAYVSLFDNDEASEKVLVELEEGAQSIEVKHSFALPGMHQLRFQIESAESGKDTLMENNSYYSYMNLEIFDKLLIIERTPDESAKLKALIEDEYKITTVCVSDTEKMPASLSELRQYDEVILVNIANSDMPEGFDKILHAYVNEIGGGLFTVGGNKINEKGEEVANAYNRKDLYGTIYQDMLPVQAIDYTPPVGVMFIIDRSGSMESNDSSVGKTKLQLAVEAAESSLYALTERDWCGVMTLESEYSEEIEMTPMPRIAEIRAAIDDIFEVKGATGGTVFTPAIERAGAALSALSGVDRRHIVLITDGMPGDSLEEEYGPMIEHFYKTAGITVTIVAIGIASGSDAETNMKQAAELGHGRLISVTDGSQLSALLREELQCDAIKEVYYGEFYPTIYEHISAVNGLTNEDMPPLYGFYGTKVRKDAQVGLMGEYVPIYAQWKYGEGSVGSFMCDLEGIWSADFLASPTAQRFLKNVLAALQPTHNIRAQDIDVEIVEDNYTTTLNIYTELEENQIIEVTVTGPSANGTSVQTATATAAENYTRFSFVIRDAGIHEIVVQKKDLEGNTLGTFRTHKAFSYSEEYDAFVDQDQALNLIASLAENGKGTVDEEPSDVFRGFSETLHRTFDPRFLFIILAIVLFLLDIIVRKFKFKWPHELVREYKAKKSA